MIAVLGGRARSSLMRSAPACADGCGQPTAARNVFRMLRLSGDPNPHDRAAWGDDMNLMKSFFLGSTAGLAFLSTVLLVAIPSNPAQARSQHDEGGCSEPDVCS